MAAPARFHRRLGVLPAVLLSLALVPQVAAAEAELTLERSRGSFANGDPIWLLKLVKGSRLVRTWQAASGAANRQQLDRRWSPGNGAPLPPGSYRLGTPEPWGQDLWIDLQPEFSTSRSGLGLHHCLPGVGCICLPDRQALSAVAASVQTLGIRRLRVLN
jgi:hypothetical protein